MNDAHPASRSSRLAPLVLRLGIAAILGYGGVQHYKDRWFSTPVAPATPTETASPVTDIPVTDSIANALETEASPTVTPGLGDEVKVKFARQDVIAIGELLVAAALTLGWFTRLCAMGVLAFAGAVSYAGVVGTGDSAWLQYGADIFQQHSQSLALLAVGAVSLLISGCGCLGVDKRRAARKALIQAAKS